MLVSRIVQNLLISFHKSWCRSCTWDTEQSTKMMMVIQITFVSVRVIWGTGQRADERHGNPPQGNQEHSTTVLPLFKH